VVGGRPQARSEPLSEKLPKARRAGVRSGRRSHPGVEAAGQIHLSRCGGPGVSGEDTVPTGMAGSWDSAQAPQRVSRAGQPQSDLSEA
jgi:hypothetical protein